MGSYLFWVEILIWSCIGNIINAFVLYPVILTLISVFARRKPGELDSAEFNNLLVIYTDDPDKPIENLISAFMAGFDGECQVLVGCDFTEKCLMDDMDLHGVEIKHFDGKGRNYVFNTLTKSYISDNDSKETIIFFAVPGVDAKPIVFRKMATEFYDSSIGLVQPAFTDAKSRDTLTGKLFEAFEWYLIRREDHITSTVNKTSPLFAVRSGYYDYLKYEFDHYEMDAAMQMVRKGMRAVVARGTSATVTGTNKMKEMISERAGKMSVILRNIKIFLPGKSTIGFFLYTHKVLGYLMPIFLLGIVLGTIMLPAESELWPNILYIQIAFYLIGILGWLLNMMKIDLVPITSVYFILRRNVIYLAALLKMVFTRRPAYARDTFDNNGPDS